MHMDAPNAEAVGTELANLETQGRTNLTGNKVESSHSSEMIVHYTYSYFYKVSES